MGSISSAIGPVLQGAGSLATLYGANIKAQGEVQAANAQAQAATFNAGVDLVNAGIAQTNATMTAQAGEANAGIIGQQTRAQVSGIETNQAAAGVDVNSGSAVGVRESAAAVGMLNALTARSNAAKQAYGFQTQAASDVASAGLAKQEAGYDISAGNTAAKGTILGADAAAASNFGSYLMQNSLNPGSTSGSSDADIQQQYTNAGIAVDVQNGMVNY